MQSPVQLVSLLRPKTRSDLLASTAVSSLIFSATPFLLPVVAAEYGVSLGAASLISSAQLGGFVLASWLGGRMFTPSVRLLLGTLLAVALAQVASAVTDDFQLLLTLRGLGGFGLGLIAWMGWQEVFGDSDLMGDLAVIGPIVGVVGAPLASFLAEVSGSDAVFLTLAVLALLPVPFALRQREMRTVTPNGTRTRPVPAAVVILACLFLMTAGGSAVFVFGAALGTGRVGLNPFVLSLAFSANAVVGIPAARYRGIRPFSGVWVLVTGAMALVMTNVTIGLWFWLAIALWGFAFWAGVPGIFTMLANRSAHPAERAGDAQSIMAAGRVIGPLVGAGLLETGSYPVLGLVAGGTMLVTGLVLIAVERLVAPLETGVAELEFASR